MQNDTICALATKTGGALGIIRISGAQTLEILSHIFTHDLTKAQANSIVYGHIVNHDEVIESSAGAEALFPDRSEAHPLLQGRAVRR